jgi:mono/diheme cytochrome c family protein
MKFNLSTTVREFYRDNVHPALRFRSGSFACCLVIALLGATPIIFSSRAQIADPDGVSGTASVGSPAKFLSADADSKEIVAKPDELVARFTFYVTNISDSVIVITNLQRTCGCTEATMPSQPWRLEPGASGPIQASIDLRGKAGKISKTLTIQSPSGSKGLSLNVNIPSAAPASSSSEIRALNQQIAAKNRQAVFNGDCAKCHVEPAVGKIGHELYQAGCAICHDAENRAAMVPDLKALGHSLSAEDWKTWITSSKPGSMMPAFGRENNGPLSEEQIASLVDYLTRAVPRGS